MSGALEAYENLACFVLRGQSVEKKVEGRKGTDNGNC